MNYDIIILGGGASGLCTAILAKTEKNRILVIDKDTRPGRKILSTGNGKCNLTNEYCEVSKFGSNPEKLYPYFSDGKKDFIEDVIGRYDWKDTIEFFGGLGLLTINRNGYIYPRTEQAAAVLEIFEREIKSLGIEVLSGYRPQNVINKNGYFIIDEQFAAKNLVVSTGGLSSPKNDADGFGYKIAQGFGHSIIKPRPALCGIRCKEKIFKEISAVRQNGLLTLYDEKHRFIMSCYGNIQFTDYGLSGIPAFQLSGTVGRMLEEGRHPVIEVDLLPGVSVKKIADMIKGHEENCLLGIVNSRLAKGFEKKVRSEGLKPGKQEYINRLAYLVRHFEAEPERLPSFKNSQVTAGGISTGEISSASMESKKKNGLYFTGEIIDVNGICGGYNLQWAFSTAFICGSALHEKYDQDKFFKA